MNETEAQIVEFKPSEVAVIRRKATDVAGACREIVMKTASALQGRKYVRVEGWQSIAAMFGATPSIELVESVEGGVRAVARIDLPDGRQVRAEGFVGDDEKTWSGRPMYARRAMAQTRAISRVCRSAFAFVVVLIDENLSTTPAEEMDGVDSGAVIEAPPKGVEGLRARVAAATNSTQPPAPARSPPRQRRLDVEQAANSSAPATHDRSFAFGFGRDKGVPLSSLAVGSLKWYRQCLENELADATKAQYHEKTRGQLAAVVAEEQYRQG